MKVFSVVGNRPQFVKAAPTSVALRERGIDESRAAHGAALRPRALAGLLRGARPRGAALRARPAHRRHEPRCRRRLPGRCARSSRTGCSSTATPTRRWPARSPASQAGVPIAHVEAGLRSGDLSMPEERNRIEVDRIAQLLFAPDERSRDQLAAEGVPGRAEVVGDVMADATRLFEPDRAQAGSIRSWTSPTTCSRSTARRIPSPTRLRRLIETPERDGAHLRLPGPPAHAQGAGRARDRARAAAARGRAGRLPRDARARRRSESRGHRLGRPAEGGLLATACRA